MYSVAGPGIVLARQFNVGPMKSQNKIKSACSA